MLSSPHFGPAPVGFLPPGGAHPFLPASPLLLPQPPFFRPPQDFLGPPFLPPLMVPCGQNFVPPPFKQQHISGGPEGWNFQHAGTPLFQGGWSQQRSPWKNKKPRPARVVGNNCQSGTGPKPVLFVCSPCHKEYKSRETYETHLATHIKCSHCEYKCGRGAMYDHELVHFLPAELKFSSQEDIEKWRAERRKNFPTAENVMRKKELQEQRDRRGDVVDTPLYRYVSRVCGSDGGFSRQRGGKNNRWVVGSNRKFSQQGRHGREVSGEGGKVGGWVTGNSRQPWRREQRGRRGRRTKRGRNSSQGKEAGRHGLKDVSAKKPTLLEKLLSSEIRREQNALLQCIRHIVRTGFFGVGGLAKNLAADTDAQEEREEREEEEEEEGKGESGEGEGRDVTCEGAITEAVVWDEADREVVTDTSSLHTEIVSSKVRMDSVGQVAEDLELSSVEKSTAIASVGVHCP